MFLILSGARVFRHRSALQRLGQDIRRRHRVLHREIDADAADGRSGNSRRFCTAARSRFVRHVLENAHVEAPLVLRVLQHWPYLRRFPAWAIGMGVRPEHVRVGVG